jgi:tetratricopeptide (TPR) repeat protein
MDDKSIIINQSSNGRITVILNPEFDQSALSGLDDSSTITFGGALKSSSANMYPNLIANGHNLPQAISWIAKQDNIDLEDPLSLATEAARQLARAKASGSLKELAANAIFEASSTVRAKFLQGIIEGSAIESLFPELSWSDENQNASFAESLFSLAALFIRLGDLELAESCVDQAHDINQDSPRGLALKAIISNGYGETLGAVANLVSSLQQYEQIKDKNQLSTTSAIDIEKINAELKQGLDALNKKDNQEALAHFASAVCQFDPFYQKQGLSFS